MVGWHHRLNGLEFEQALGVGDGQGSLVCCSPWGRRVRQGTEKPLLLSIATVTVINSISFTLHNKLIQLINVILLGAKEIEG